jgi:hypothetical protein
VTDAQASEKLWFEPCCCGLLSRSAAVNNDGALLHPCFRATAALPRAKIRAPKGATAGSEWRAFVDQIWIDGRAPTHLCVTARGSTRTTARSISAERWATSKQMGRFEQNVADRADVVSSIELASAKGVAIQTGTASACSICSKQGRKKESSDNKPELHHKGLSTMH